ncbi:MAG: hypothetical protein AB1472_02705 [Candidatus Omnitrophota bacterium]
MKPRFLGFLTALFLGISIFCLWKYSIILKEKQSLKESLVKLETQNQELIVDLKQKVLDNEKLNQEKASLENDLVALQNSFAQLEDNITKLNDKITRLKQENKFLIKERFALKEKVSYTQTPKSDISSFSPEYVSIKEIKKQIKDLKRKIKQVKIEIKKQKIREKQERRKVDVLPTP